MSLASWMGSVPKHAIWTFASDESGRFEEHDTRHVLGGVLLPGTPEQSAEKLADFRHWCSAEGFAWPPHSTEIPLARRVLLREQATARLAKVGGLWLFVVANARDREEAGPSLALYIQMLNSTIDLVGRVATLFGAKQLHLRPATRTKPLPSASFRRGFAKPAADAPGKMRPMSEAEVRSTMDALRREPAGALPAYPEPATVRADSAKYPDAHPGLTLADIGCNALFNGLASGDALREFQDGFQPAVVVTLRSGDALRALDRALRDSPASLVSAAKIVHRFAADASGVARNEGDLKGLRASSLACAEALFVSHLASLANVSDGGACARALLAQAEVELAARSGNYEGLARALSAAWCGSDEHAPLALRQRQQLRDRTLQARLWRVVLECANHRGDLDAARSAVAAFEVILGQGRSLALNAEEFQVRNLAVVALQNELPFDAERAEASCAELERATDSFRVNIEAAVALVGNGSFLDGSGAPSSAPELALWKHAAASAPVWERPDRELGMAFGTAARSYAFAGRLREALQAALAARSRFADSSDDLTFNAAVIARIELERARIDPDGARSGAQLLQASLQLSGAHAVATDRNLAALLQARPAARFQLDLALRAALWAPSVPVANGLFERLARPDFVSALTRGELRSHPTELVARHAAEVLHRHGGPREAIASLFRLSVAQCAEHPASSTLARLGSFTRRLLEDPNFAGHGPRGSVDNPSFEYR